MLLDTTFFIDLAAELQSRQLGPCQTWLDAHRRDHKLVSVVTIGEFAVGATESETRRFFRGYSRLSLGYDLAIFAGRLQAGLKFEVGENDLWIAATAMRFEVPLVTRDKQLHRIPGLKALAY